jgi:hypothetical protein
VVVDLGQSQLTEDDFEVVLSYVDKNASGSIEFDEFCAWIESEKDDSGMVEKGKVDEIWDWADADGDGFLNFEEIRLLMQTTDQQEFGAEDYASFCAALGVKDAEQGMKFSVLKRLYDEGMADVESDFYHIFHKKKLDAIWNWASSDANLAGRLKFEAVRRLAVATEPRAADFDEKGYAAMCAALGVDTEKGISFDDLKCRYLDKAYPFCDLNASHAALVLGGLID